MKKQSDKTKNTSKVSQSREIKNASWNPEGGGMLGGR
jgi:hypothetical protein